MATINPFLWFDTQAEEAMNLYASIFKNSRVLSTQKMGDQVFAVEFELEGQKFMAMNAGPQHKFNESISMFVSVDTQAEVDDLWTKLIAGGGREDRCGWLKDKFGLSWQIIPKALPKLLRDPDPQKAKAAMDAMLTMKKIVIADLEKAAANA
jgi:predicted 3-demethylubiquinone-9 3-methyltransferase (glyoxalase superfamily)